jgi:hypothetical protein
LGGNMEKYITRCPFSLSRLVKVTDTGQVVYKAEKQSCRFAYTFKLLGVK